MVIVKKYIPKMTRNELMLRRLEAWIHMNIPGYGRRVKETSRLMRFLRYVLFFNKRFLSGYITTAYPKVYFPEAKNHIAHRVWPILCHELVHLSRAKQETPVLHGIKYVFPQILTVLSLLALLAIPWSNWWLLCLLFLLCAAPLPAPFRMKEELEGYTMSMAVEYWRFGQVSDAYIEYVAERFYGPDYYYMWPFRAEIVHKLKVQRLMIYGGKYDRLYHYGKVKELIEEIWPRSHA